MEFEVVACRECQGGWIVEAIGSEGEPYLAEFLGPLAQERATQYAQLQSELEGFFDVASCVDVWKDIPLAPSGGGGCPCGGNCACGN